MVLSIIALVVSGVAAGGTVWSVVYTRRATADADRSADSAAITAGFDADRRHSELTPRFQISVLRSNPGSDTLRMSVSLLGPHELERLDALTVVIRDDHPWRADYTPLGGGPTPEEVAAQIWGRWRFTPGVGPGADSVRGIPGADSTGRTCPTGGLPVGESLPFQLEPNHPPRWSQQTMESWPAQMGDMLRLRLECGREGQTPWVLTTQVIIDENGAGNAEIPAAVK